MGASTVDETETQSDVAQASAADQGGGSMGPPPSFDNRMDPVGGIQAGKPAGFGAMASLGQGNSLLVQQQASRANVGAPSGLGQCTSRHLFTLVVRARCHKGKHC